MLNSNGIFFYQKKKKKKGKKTEIACVISNTIIQSIIKTPETISILHFYTIYISKNYSNTLVCIYGIKYYV